MFTIATRLHGHQEVKRHITGNTSFLHPERRVLNIKVLYAYEIKWKLTGIAHVSWNRVTVLVLCVYQHSDAAGHDYDRGYPDEKVDQRWLGFSIRWQGHEPLDGSGMNTQGGYPSERHAHADGPKRIPQKRIWIHAEQKIYHYCDQKKKWCTVVPI